MSTWLRRRREERGSILVIAVLALPVLILFITFVVDVGNWFEHKRHLQTQADAGALAGGDLFRFPCSDSSIEAAARKYGGDPNAVSPYNTQVKDSRNVHELINSDKFFNEPGAADWVSIGHPCSSMIVDVKMTQQDLPWFFGVHVVPAINAHARVEIRQIDTVAGALPVGVPDSNPKYAFARFIDETTGNALSGCTSGGVAVANCEFSLVKQPGSSGGLVFWNNSGAPATVPIGSNTRIGVRIRLVGGNDSTAGCTAPLVECYDQGSTNGIVFIRGYTAANGTPPQNPPNAGDVSLFDGTCTDPYFSSSSTACTIGVHAKVAFPTGVTPASSCPASGNSFTGGCVYANVNGNNIPLTFNSGTGYWNSTGSNFISVGPATGPTTINLFWRVRASVTISGNGCGNGGGCSGTISNVQRNFTATPDRSGPIKQAIVSEGGSQWTNSFQTSSTHNLVIQIGMPGNLQDASSASDPVVLLRVVKDRGGNGSQNQSVDCDPAFPNLRDEIRQGCAPSYTKNTGQACPGNSTTLWASAQPWNCVAIQTGGSIGQMTQGIQDRILCGGQPCQGNPGCTAPNHWSQFPNLPSGDPRIVPVFLTPFGTFSQAGNEVLPVTDFAEFYVTGWGGNGNGNNDPCPGADAAPSGDIAGHFIKYVQTLNNGTTGTQLCDPTALAPCVAVMTQ